MKMCDECSMEEKLVELASQAYETLSITVEQVRLSAEKWDELERALAPIYIVSNSTGEHGIRLSGQYNIIKVWKRENKE